MVGWWAGTDTDWREFLDVIKTEWKGSEYRLLSKQVGGMPRGNEIYVQICLWLIMFTELRQFKGAYICSKLAVLYLTAK